LAEAMPIPANAVRNRMSAARASLTIAAGTIANPKTRTKAIAPFHHRSGGRATLGVEVRIVDESDREVPRVTVGQICARGDVVMMGYWNRPEETAKAIVDGWMHTGDAGHMDEDGFVYIVDRFKDMIISGGRMSTLPRS
jgi:acyl-CoA synthetase (AMP-forming)/AMP-acid ligase II